MALAAILPWLLIWPIALYQRSPELFHEWFWVNNFGRFLGENQLGPPEPAGLLPGGSAVVSRSRPGRWRRGRVWRGRGRIRTDPGMILPLTAIVVIVGVLSLAADARELYAKPVLVPFALLAVPGLLSLRRGAANGFWWFSILFFGFFLLLGLVLLVRARPGHPRAGAPPHAAHAPGLHAGVRPVQVRPGGRLHRLLHLGRWPRLKRSAERPLVAWAAGVTMVWGLLTIFFWEYADSRNSYRPLVMEVVRQLPRGYTCISSRSLGEPQRALFEYFAGIVTYRDEVPSRRRDCDILLVQGMRTGIYQPAASSGSSSGKVRGRATGVSCSGCTGARGSARTDTRRTRSPMTCRRCSTHHRTMQATAQKRRESAQPD